MYHNLNRNFKGTYCVRVVKRSSVRVPYCILGTIVYVTGCFF